MSVELLIFVKIDWAQSQFYILVFEVMIQEWNGWSFVRKEIFEKFEQSRASSASTFLPRVSRPGDLQLAQILKFLIHNQLILKQCLLYRVVQARRAFAEKFGLG